MKAHEIMTKQVIKLKEDDYVYAGVRKLLEYKISALPVVNERNELIAMLRDEDIIAAIGKENEFVLGNLFYAEVFQVHHKDFFARAQEILSLNVMEIAQKKFFAVPWDEKVENIIPFMARRKIKQLPVVRHSVLAGIITRSDCLRAVYCSVNECLKKSVC